MPDIVDMYFLNSFGASLKEVERLGQNFIPQEVVKCMMLSKDNEKGSVKEYVREGVESFFTSFEKTKILLFSIERDDIANKDIEKIKEICNKLEVKVVN